jgi:citrate lyase subunit beta/citryl-CoA lyase
MSDRRGDGCARAPVPDWRSILFVPADRPRFIERAHERGADAIQLDLEDAVAPVAKPAARAAMPQAIATLAAHGLPVVVRINRAWRDAFADLDAAVRAGVHAITIPKVEEPGHVRAVAEMVGEFERERGLEPGRIGLLLLIESPAALPRLTELATCSSRVIAMTLGPEDYCLAAGCDALPEALLAPNLAVAQACAAAELLPLGFVGSIAAYDDLAAFEGMVAQARRLGFRGAAVVHPSQVPILNAGFGPSTAEIAWAQRVVAAAQAAGEGAFRLDGRMVDRPVLLRARRWLAMASR